MIFEGLVTVSGHGMAWLIIGQKKNHLMRFSAPDVSTFQDSAREIPHLGSVPPRLRHGEDSCFKDIWGANRAPPKHSFDGQTYY